MTVDGLPCSNPGIVPTTFGGRVARSNSGTQDTARSIVGDRSLKLSVR
jgi:hypothetical protein